MNEPTYNPNAQAELDEVMGKESSQQAWKAKAKNLPIDKNKGSEALRKIHEEMTAKEIWYVWDGQSPIPGNATRYIDRNGHHHIPRFTIPFKHSGFGAGGEIVAYTLGEKRERVDCDGCKGCGNELEYDGETGGLYSINSICEDCKGRGYIWKIGEKK